MTATFVDEQEIRVYAQQRLRIFLKALMAERKLTTADLAKVMKCKQSAAAMKVRGERDFSFGQAVALAKEYDFSLDAIFTPSSELAVALDEILARRTALTQELEAVTSMERGVYALSGRFVPFDGRRFARLQLTAPPPRALAA